MVEYVLKFRRVMYMSENKKPHNRIAELRKEKGLTLQQVADAIGVGNNTISRYETGKREPKLETWQKLANYFDVTVYYLQGYGLSIDQAKNKVISIIHNAYFEDTELTSAVDSYLRTISPKKKAIFPFDFYKDNETDYPLTEQVKKFWIDNFSFIFKSESFEDTLLNIDDYPDSLLLNDTVFTINKRILNLQKTNVGKIYTSQFSKQNNQKFMDLERTILVSNKADVSIAFDEYIKYLQNLKSKLLNS
ncbi:DNA-binding helix-turn-helix protein [Limosilactobacillus reuteri CF48-3A]|uniref:DNA-binding helix-turn-helix protein n=3 Tax=Limosilactobacillus reuteri TaxID=1598 RepID=A0A8D9VQ33_LIMRT|nr:DNA-binding helix-turn-helix protein [Limosilactobacillus reuteri CF48-3A]